MSLNPNIIPKRTRDPGAAHQFADVHRRLKKLEGQYGVIGGGATITGPLIETADSGTRAWIQGEDGSGATPGVFVSDGSGNPAISMIPGEGIVIASSDSVWSDIEWQTGSATDASVGVSRVTVAGGYSGADMVSRSHSPDFANEVNIGIRCIAGPEASTWMWNGVTVFNSSANRSITLADQHGNGTWYGTVSAANLTTTSDESSKEDIVDVAEEVSVRLHQLRVVAFRWREGNDRLNYGVIAQEVTNHIPEIVGSAKIVVSHEGRKKRPTELGDVPTIDQGSLLALTVAEVQRLEGRLTVIEERTKDGQA